MRRSKTSKVGDGEGPNVGITVGKAVGIWVGLNVTGIWVGLLVGDNLAEGFIVGLVVGLVVGFIVGLAAPFTKSLERIEHSNNANNWRNVMILWLKILFTNTVSAVAER